MLLVSLQAETVSRGYKFYNVRIIGCIQLLTTCLLKVFPKMFPHVLILREEILPDFFSHSHKLNP